MFSGLLVLLDVEAASGGSGTLFFLGLGDGQRVEEKKDEKKEPATKKQNTGTPVNPQVAIRQNKLLENLNSQVGNIEKTADKICNTEVGGKAEEGKSGANAAASTMKAQNELSRLITMSKNSITSTRKFIEQQKSQHFTGDSASKLDPISERINEAEKRVLEKEGRFLVCGFSDVLVSVLM